MKRLTIQIILTLYIFPCFSQWETTWLQSYYEMPVSISFINSNTGYILTEDLSYYAHDADSLYVYITADGGQSFNKIIEIPSYQYQGEIYVTEKWGIILGTQKIDTLDFYGKQFIIIFEDNGKKWRFADYSSVGTITEVCFNSSDTSYFVSKSADNSYSIGKIWDNGDSIKVVKSHISESGIIFNLKIFNDGTGYYQMYRTLFKTDNFFDSIYPFVDSIFDYTFSNSQDGAIIKYPDYQLSFTHDGGKSFTYSSDLWGTNFAAPLGLSSNILMLNNHSIAYCVSIGTWHNGDEKFVYFNESGDYHYTTLIDGFGDIVFHWICMSPDSNVCYCIGINNGGVGLLWKTNSISQVMFNENLVNSDLINIYPNPCRDKLVLSFSNAINGRIYLNLINIMGGTLKKINITVLSDNNSIILDIEELKPGYYILQIIHNNASYNTSFLKID